MANFKDLLVFKNSYKLSVIIHRLSLKLPKAFTDIALQIRRCSKSIPTNIIEGYARNKSIKDRINFLRTSLGSNDEVLVHLAYLKDLAGYKQEIIDRLMESYIINGKRINNLIAYNQKQANQQTRIQDN